MSFSLSTFFALPYLLCSYLIEFMWYGPGLFEGHGFIREMVEEFKDYKMTLNAQRADGDWKYAK